MGYRKPQPPGPSPLGTGSSVEPARGLKEGQTRVWGRAQTRALILSRDKHFLGLGDACGWDPHAPPGLPVWFPGGPGAPGLDAAHRRHPTENLQGPWLLAALVLAGQGSPRRPLRMTPPFRMKNLEPCWSRASQAGSRRAPPPDPSHGKRVVPCTQHGFKKPAGEKKKSLQILGPRSDWKMHCSPH